MNIKLDKVIVRDISEERQRYDVGIIISNKESKYDLPVRNIANGCYAIFEVELLMSSNSSIFKLLPPS